MHAVCDRVAEISGLLHQCISLNTNLIKSLLFG